MYTMLYIRREKEGDKYEFTVHRHSHNVTSYISKWSHSRKLFLFKLSGNFREDANQIQANLKI